MGGRRVGMVFQRYALLPSSELPYERAVVLPVQEEEPELAALASAKYQRTSELGTGARVSAGHKTTTLSGGEKQRVAHDRCIARTRILPRRRAIRESGSSVERELPRQAEDRPASVQHHACIRGLSGALIVPHLVVVMHRGRIERVGIPQGTYDKLTNVFLAGVPESAHGLSAPISLIDARSTHQEQRHENGWLLVHSGHVQITSEHGAGSLRETIARILRLPPMNTTLFTIRQGRHGGPRARLRRREPPDGVIRCAGPSCDHLSDNTSGLRLTSHPEPLTIVGCRIVGVVMPMAGELSSIWDLCCRSAVLTQIARSFRSDGRQRPACGD
jgi:hypothetical protein